MLYIYPLDKRYSISSDGRVYSNIKKIFLKPQLSNKGYLRVSISRKTHRIHRMVAICFIPNPDNLPEVNHKDGDKRNNNHWNLEWVTTKANKEHAMKHGLFRIFNGEDNGKAKLSNIQVIEIKQLMSIGSMKQYKIAEMYKVSPSTVSAIKQGRLRKC